MSRSSSRLAAHDRSLDAGQAALRQLRRRVDEREPADALLLSAQLQEPDVLEAEADGRARGPFGDEDLARLGELLEPRRGVHRDAGDHRLARRRVERGHRLAGVDAVRISRPTP